MTKKTELEIASEKSVCLKALNSDWTDWDYAFFGGIHVREAKEKGLTIVKCQSIRWRLPNNVVVHMSKNGFKKAYRKPITTHWEGSKIQFRGGVQYTHHDSVWVSMMWCGLFSKYLWTFTYIITDDFFDGGIKADDWINLDDSSVAGLLFFFAKDNEVLFRWSWWEDSKSCSED